MKINRERIKDLLLVRTTRAEQVLEEARFGPVEGKLEEDTGKYSAIQKLMDMSSFDCNKYIILELFNIMLPTNRRINIDALDLSSERRKEILFPYGTVVRVNKHNDHHDYPIGSLAMIARHYKEGPRNKTYMQALREDGTLGSGLYYYGLYNFDVFTIGTISDVEEFVERCIPEETSNPTILRAINLTQRGEYNERE